MIDVYGEAPVEVLHNDPDKHVEDEEADKQEERDEVQQPPLVVIPSELEVKYTPSS